MVHHIHLPLVRNFIRYVARTSTVLQGRSPFMPVNVCDQMN